MEKRHVGLEIRTGEGSWKVADRTWFAQNPGRDWYVRPVLLGEIEDMQRLGDPTLAGDIAEMRKALADPACNADVFRVAVFQLRPGLRRRVPFLGVEGSTDTNVMFVTGTGESVGPDEMLERFRRVMQKATDIPVQGGNDTCPGCRRKFETGDVVSVLRPRAGVQGPPSIECNTCVIATGRRQSVMGLCAFVEQEHAAIPQEQWPRPLRRRLEHAQEKLKAYQAKCAT